MAFCLRAVPGTHSHDAAPPTPRAGYRPEYDPDFEVNVFVGRYQRAWRTTNQDLWLRVHSELTEGAMGLPNSGCGNRQGPSRLQLSGWTSRNVPVRRSSCSFLIVTACCTLPQVARDAECCRMASSRRCRDRGKPPVHWWARSLVGSVRRNGLPTRPSARCRTPS